MNAAHIEWLAGNDAAADRILRDGLAVLEAIDERAYYPTAALQLAFLLYWEGRYDEVREWCAKARATTGADDVTNFLDLDLLDACLLAREGKSAEATVAAARARERLNGIQMNSIEVHAHATLSEVFALTQDTDAARDHGRLAIEIAERKGDVSLAARIRERLQEVGVDGG
jgi:hypothetical protein